MVCVYHLQAIYCYCLNKDTCSCMWMQLCMRVCKLKKKKKRTTMIEKNVLLYLQAILSLGGGQLSLLNQHPEHCVVQIVYVTCEIKTHT